MFLFSSSSYTLYYINRDVDDWYRFINIENALFFDFGIEMRPENEQLNLSMKNTALKLFAIGFLF
jgi:hypothetical protein